MKSELIYNQDAMDAVNQLTRCTVFTISTAGTYAGQKLGDDEDGADKVQAVQHNLLMAGIMCLQLANMAGGNIEVLESPDDSEALGHRVNEQANELVERQTLTLDDIVNWAEERAEQAAHNNGHDSGYNEGYDDGFDAGLKVGMNTDD